MVRSSMASKQPRGVQITGLMSQQDIKGTSMTLQAKSKVVNDEIKAAQKALREKRSRKIIN